MQENSRLTYLLGLLEEDPNDNFVLFALAKEYESNNMAQKALDYYLRLQKNDPNYVGLYYHLGALYQEIDDLEKAMEVYDQGIKIATSIRDLHALSELNSAKMNLELEM